MNEVPVEYETNMETTYETDNYQRSTETKEWTRISDECVSGGALTDNCNIVAASKGTGQLNVIAKKLSCGCILIPVDTDEISL